MKENPLDVAKNIVAKIQHLDGAPTALKKRAETVAHAEAEYEKAIGVTIAKLEAGIEFVIDNIIIKDTVAGVREKKARAICWQEKQKLTEADLLYKSTVKHADIVCAQLNGWQSINRHLSQV